MATHSNTLAWKIPQMEEPGRLRPWGLKETSLSFTLDNNHITCERFHIH